MTGDKLHSKSGKLRKNFTSASLLLFLAIVASLVAALIMVNTINVKRPDESAFMFLMGFQLVLVGVPSVICVGLATGNTFTKIASWTEQCRLASRTITPLLFMASLGIFLAALFNGASFILEPDVFVGALLVAFPVIGLINWTVFSLYLWGLSTYYGKPSRSINITLLLWISSILAIIVGAAKLAWEGIQTSDTGATILLAGYALAFAGLVGTMFSLARIAKIVKELQADGDLI